MKVIIIGAGRVGCGALGMAFALQGQQLVLAARRDDVVASINTHGYDVHTKGVVEAHVPVRGVRAVNFTKPDFVDEVADADQLYTCVRPDNLPAIAPLLANAIIARVQNGARKPLDVFSCENLKNAGSQLERLVYTNVPFQHAQAVQDSVSFSAAVSDRIVSGQETDADGRLVFTADATGDVIFDRLQLKGEFDTLPPFKGLDNFPASIEEKLFVLNCGHAVCAYLGHIRGYAYIHEAIADEEIARTVVGAMLEAQRALQCKHGRSFHYGAHINEMLESFRNAALMDTIARVARDPIRKLQAEDRLVGPAKLAYRYNIDAPNLIRGCAAGFMFNGRDDAQAAELGRYVSDLGDEKAIETVAQLKPWNPLSKLIRQEIAILRS